MRMLHTDMEGIAVSVADREVSIVMNQVLQQYGLGLTPNGSSGSKRRVMLTSKTMKMTKAELVAIADVEPVLHMDSVETLVEFFIRDGCSNLRCIQAIHCMLQNAPVQIFAKLAAHRNFASLWRY